VFSTGLPFAAVPFEIRPGLLPGRDMRNMAETVTQQINGSETWLGDLDLPAFLARQS
jgi:hypothetical protein